MDFQNNTYTRTNYLIKRQQFVISGFPVKREIKHTVFWK